MNDTDRAEWIKAVVDQYSGPLTRYAAVILDDLDRARDVVQDTFLRLWREDPERVRPKPAEWLFTVCRNRALDVLKKERRLQPLDEMEMTDQSSPEPSPASAAEVSDSHGRVLRLLARLPKSQQEVVRLKFQNGLSYLEISRVTRRTISNVGVLLHMAIKTLRQQMQAETAAQPLFKERKLS